MKKIAILLSVIVLGSLSAMAQGTIAFANSGSGQLLRIATGTDSGSLSNSTVIGTNATSVSLGAGPGQVNIRLYVAANGTPATFDPQSGLPTSGLILVGSGTNSGLSVASFQGTFNGGNPFTLPAPFDGSGQIEYYFWAQTQNGNYTGHSVLGINYSPATGIATPTATFGPNSPLVQGFTLTPVPEPSTIALGGLGVAALLLFRRRK